MKTLTHNRAANFRGPSRFKEHDALLLRLAERYPTKSGDGIAFDFAFREDAALREKLGATDKKDLGALRQHAYIVIRKARKAARKTRGAAAAQPSHEDNGHTNSDPVPALSQDDKAKRKYQRKPQAGATHRFCPVCGTDQLPIATAIAMITRV